MADLVELREAGAIDEVLVVDASSSDGTAAWPRRPAPMSATSRELLPEHGPVLGKGDAMWRALSVIEGDVIVLPRRGLGGLRAALRLRAGRAAGVRRRQIEFVKAFYRRPLKLGEVSLPEGGGRVTELTARPLLNLFYPELAGFRQPLAGEIAGTRELFQRLPFATGYAVEIAMLIDAWRAVGLDGMAQVDIELRQNRHQPLGDLTRWPTPSSAPYAYAWSAKAASARSSTRASCCCRGRRWRRTRCRSWNGRRWRPW